MMADCEAPSWLMLSGVAVMLTDCPNSDGPVIDGTMSWLNGARRRESDQGDQRRTAGQQLSHALVTKIAEFDLDRLPVALISLPTRSWP